MKTLQIQPLLRVATMAGVLVLGAAGTQWAQAEPGGHGHHRGGGHAMMADGGLFGGRIGHMLELVGATEAQRSQIATIFKSARQDLAGQRDAGRQLHQQLATLYTAPNIDAAAIESVRAQMSAQREAASKRLSQASIEAARVLTPEQRTKIGEVMKKRHARKSARPAG